MCNNIQRLIGKMSSKGNGSAAHGLCDDLVWSVRRWGFDDDDPDIVNVEEDIFRYAKHNLAVVNVYIKVRSSALHRKFNLIRLMQC